MYWNHLSMIRVQGVPFKSSSSQMNQPEFLCDSSWWKINTSTFQNHWVSHQPVASPKRSWHVHQKDQPLVRPRRALLHWCDFFFERVFKNHWFPTGKLVHLSFWCKELLQNASWFFTCKALIFEAKWSGEWCWNCHGSTRKGSPMKIRCFKHD